MTELNHNNRVAPTEFDPITQQNESSPMKKKKYPHYPYDEQDYGSAYQYEPDFKGPVRKRGCTDIFCLLLFLAFLGGWGFVAYFAISEGEIEKVIYPTNSKGEICGRGEYVDRPNLLFFDLTRCLNPASLVLGCPTPQVCVEKCPEEKYSAWAAYKSGLSSDVQIKTKMRPFCAKLNDGEWNRRSVKSLLDSGLCPTWMLPSTNVLGRCLPTLTSTSQGEETDPNKTVVTSDMTMDKQSVKEGTLTTAVTRLGAFLQLRNFGERVFNDLTSTGWMIGVALLAAVVISFLWIVLMRFVAGVMVWASIGLVFSLFGGLFGYTLYRYLKIKNLQSAQGNIFMVNFTPDYLKDVLKLSDTWLAFAIICGIIFGIILLVLIALRTRILIAIELIEEASKSVGQMATTLLFPIFPFVLQVAVAFCFTTVALYLSSAGKAEYRVSYLIDHEQFERSAKEVPCRNCINNETLKPYNLEDICVPEVFEINCPSCPEVQCQFTKYVKADESSWMQWYNLFGLYWGLFFASALSELILAGVFATWYWTWNKKDVPCCILARSFSNAVIFHLGTVAFGSLIIAVIRMIRTVLDYVESKLKKFNNELTRCLICMCKCCLYCLEKFMRFINRNAYIMCAIKGSNFYVSAKDAFSLLMRNVVRVVVLNNIVAFLLFLGKLVIVAGVGCLAYFVFSGGIPELKDDIPTLNYFLTPIVVIVIGTYVITSLFFGVYEMAVDTLFLCFLEDLERNDGTPSRPYFMSRSLQKVVGKMQKFNDGRA